MSTENPVSASSESLSDSGSEISIEPLESQPAFGWTFYAERINGRFAMLGFTALVIIELLTRQDFFTWLGLR